MEPLLKSVAETLPSVTVRYGCEFVSLTQDEIGVTAQVRDDDRTADQLRKRNRRRVRADRR